jgi:hypothetical protein
MTYTMTLMPREEDEATKARNAQREAVRDMFADSLKYPKIEPKLDAVMREAPMWDMAPASQRDKPPVLAIIGPQHEALVEFQQLSFETTDGVRRMKAQPAIAKRGSFGGQEHGPFRKPLRLPKVPEHVTFNVSDLSAFEREFSAWWAKNRTKAREALWGLPVEEVYFAIGFGGKYEMRGPSFTVGLHGTDKLSALKEAKAYIDRHCTGKHVIIFDGPQRPETLVQFFTPVAKSSVRFT